VDYVLRKPSLQFWTAPAKPDVSPEAEVRDRVCSATPNVFANLTRGENPAPGKLHAVDDFVRYP
jgi:hypothetical protein